MLDLPDCIQPGELPDGPIVLRELGRELGAVLSPYPTCAPKDASNRQANFCALGRSVPPAAPFCTGAARLLDYAAVHPPEQTPADRAVTGRGPVSEPPSHALSIDIGGTFTDFSLLDLSTGEVSVHKVLTNPDEPQQALMEGAVEALEAAGASRSMDCRSLCTAPRSPPTRSSSAEERRLR